jgi:hypothetical protein
MLLSFRFANHRSFRDEQQLNLMPVYGSDAAQPADLEPVRTVGIFGANASGKSNCLDALAFMRRMVFRSDRDVEPGLGISRDPFLLSPQSRAEPSRYVVDLVLDGVHHTYGFTINDERVLEEWLYQYPLKKKRRVFERDGQGFSWGEHSGKRHDLESVARITAPTALFISTAARFAPVGDQANDDDPLHVIYRWLQGNYIRSLREPEFYSRQWPENEEDQRVVVELIRAADIGVEDVSIRRSDELNNEIKAGKAAYTQGMDPLEAAYLLFGHPQAGILPLLTFRHRGSDSSVSLRLAQESRGTQQLLDLALDAARVLRVGGMMTIDEIDASLHPILTAKLIGLFQSPTTNPQGSQLVFTSHDAALLGTIDGEEVLRRDEIWFTEKQEDGASVLYPLSDFKPRKEGENRQRRYMNGNYGAVPNLSTYLFERAMASRGDGETTSA